MDKKFYLGCDPELFMQDAAGALRSSIGLIGGSKRNPRPLEDLGDGFAVQEDNVAVEFNTPPADSQDAFDKNVEACVSYLERAINERYGYTFSKLSAALFPETELMDPRALEFGCDPDFNAWTGKKNPRPKAADPSLRSCGGHVHIGYKFKDQAHAARAVKLVELFLGVPSVLVDHGELRKELYGKAGACRYKKYGVEYRTLSNFWIFDKGLRQWVWSGVDRAMSVLDTDFDVDGLETSVCEAINTNNKVLAASLVNQYNIVMP